MAGSFILNGIEYFGNDGKNILCQEVTQAQYNALPASKLTDGIMYFITDASDGAAGFPPLIYSDEEREVGVWRDGKPLYQITYEFNTDKTLPAANSWFNTEIVRTDIEHIVKADGYRNNTNYVLLNAGINGSNEIVVMQTRDSQMPDFKGFTILYTKTADTAGSGTWTTQGGYAHHYSTNEYIIGTWIDGKPLYEKVFNISDTSCANNQWEDTGISKGSIKNIVKVVGFYGDDICFEFLGAKAESTDTNIMVLNTRGSAINLNRLILQYTKTTD